MATQIKEKGIVIAVDPGFDSAKVVNKGTMLKIPKEVVDITGKSFLGGKDSDYIKVRYVPGKEHLVGKAAAQYLHDSITDASIGSEEKANISNTYASFETIDREILIMTSIGKILIELGKDKNNMINITKNKDGSYNVDTGNVDLIYAITLPHDAVEREWGYVESKIKEAHEFSIELEDSIYNFNVKPLATICSSQVVSALFGTISDDEGQIDVAGTLLDSSSLPALVIDGGYKTLGKFLFTSVKSVEDGESNQTYAMTNVYQRVADKITNDYGRNDVDAAFVKNMMNSNDKTIPYKMIIDKEKGEFKSGMINIKEMVDEELEKSCREMIDEFDKKYNQLLNIKTILVTGGTGAAYEPIIRGIVKKEYEWLNVVLTDYEFYGKKISPEYAIAVGTYKAAYNKYAKLKASV